ncbi:MAG: hypothetical protein H6832_12785 [Planctomycetes bacterium]|nr:hypothetical protein [Planctomycetota bacterium]MCB9919270.1 hypothetical protein [Planctomycetota bacterium]
MIRPFSILTLSSTLFGATLAMTEDLASQQVYRDPAYGFEMRLPRDFREIPISMDEKWIVAKFLYKRALEPKDGWAERTPEIRVIVFPKVDMKQVIAARKQREKVKTKGKNGELVEITLLEYLSNPFRTYQEYLRENYKKGGWFVSEEKEVKVGDLDAIAKKIDVEEKMGDGLKSTLYAYEIDLGDAIYVVQLECLADHDHKFLGSIKGIANTFKDLPRTEALRTTVTSTGSAADRIKELEDAANRTLTPEERKKEKEKVLARAIEKAKSDLPKGWKSYVEGPFTVFYSTSSKFAKKVSKQAVVMWDWMHDNFDYIGEDLSVGGILRICKDSAEGSAYMETSTRSGYELTAREIVLWDDKDWGFGDYGSGKLNQAILSQFLIDKNQRLWWSLPPWLEWGMHLYIDSLKLKGSKLVSKADEWDMEVIRESLRNGTFKDSKKLIVTKYDSFNASQEDRVQCFAMISFMMEKGNRHPKYGSAIEQYLTGLDRRIRELDKKRDEARKAALEEAKKKRKSGEDEEEKKAWDAEWKKERDKIFDELLKEVFGEWSDRDWEIFDKSWRKAYK